MNAPDRYERFVVPQGMKMDTKTINSATFTIQREDHTIGNVIRMQLHNDPSVLFAGYQLPHPLQYKVVIKLFRVNVKGYYPSNGVHLQIKTTSQSSPIQAYNLAINDLDKELEQLKNVFEQEISQKQQSEYY